MADTFNSIWQKVLLRCPAVGPFLAQDMVNNAFRRIYERRRWSWLIKQGQFIVPLVYTKGRCSAQTGSYVVTGVNTDWTPDMQGRQWRIMNNTPIYTIQQYVSPTEIVLDQPWGGLPLVNSGYQIYQCYYPVPEDFHAFVSLWDPLYNWQLHLNVNQVELNAADAQRSNFTQAYVVSFRDYTTPANGVVGAPIQVVGSGPAPMSTGNYNGPIPDTYTVQIVDGGQNGTATFQWRDLITPTFQGPFPTQSYPAYPLSNGVSIYFPDDFDYVAGDTFVFNCLPRTNPGVPRYELWPHNQANYVYPYLYESRPADLRDGYPLPTYIRGDVLLEMALAECARWPGTDPDHPNPYYNLNLALTHEARSEKMIMELERQDDEVNVIDIWYPVTSMPFAPWPFGDVNWLQSHSI